MIERLPPSLLVMCEVAVMENTTKHARSLKMPRNMRIHCVVLLFIVCYLSGCGTILSRSASGDAYIDPRSPLTRMYSGTILDIYNLGADNVGFFLLLDIPLSLTADTLFLPVTVYEEFFTGQLQKSAAKGDIGTVKAMLNKGTDLHARNLGGHTALMSAAWRGQTTMVQTLLENGAEVNARQTYSGATALSYAALKGHTAVVQMLLENGADVNADGGTALMVAANADHTAVVEVLLRNGAKVNARDANGRTALMAAARAGHNATVQALLEKGAEVNTKDERGRTALIDAAEFGHPAVVQALLENGADVHAKDGSGWTALKWAMAYRQKEIVQLLKNAGARE